MLNAEVVIGAVHDHLRLQRLVHGSAIAMEIHLAMTNTSRPPGGIKPDAEHDLLMKQQLWLRGMANLSPADLKEVRKFG